MILERRDNGVRGGVRGAADHPVGHPQVDHDGAEIGDVADDLGGPLFRHAPVGAQPGALRGEAVDHVGILPKYSARVFTSAQATVIRMYTGGHQRRTHTLEERVPDDHQAEAA